MLSLKVVGFSDPVRFNVTPHRCRSILPDCRSCGGHTPVRVSTCDLESMLPHPLAQARPKCMLPHPLSQAHPKCMVPHPLSQARPKCMLPHPLSRARPKCMKTLTRLGFPPPPPIHAASLAQACPRCMLPHPLAQACPRCMCASDGNPYLLCMQDLIYRTWQPFTVSSICPRLASRA